MASPVDANRIGTIVSTAALSWNVNLPTGIVAGDLLILYLRMAATFNPSSVPSGWATAVQDLSDVTDDLTRVYYRWADGGEGISLNIPMSGSVKGAAIAWRITGAANPATQIPQATSVNIFAAGASSASPPNGIGTGGSKDYLFLSLIGCDSETSVFTCAGLTNVTNSNSGTGGAVATNCVIAGGSVQATSANYGFPSWSFSGVSSGGSTLGIIIHPGGPAAQNVSATGKASSQAFGTVTAITPLPPTGVYSQAVRDDGAIAYWRLGESSGTVAVDAMSRHNGTYWGSPTLGAASLLTGDANTAMSLAGGGANQGMYLPGNEVENQIGTGTLEAWVKTSDTGVAKTIAIKHSAFGFFAWGGTLQAYEWAGAAGPKDSGKNIADGVRHHVLMVFQEGVTNGSQMYVDGVAVGSPWTHVTSSQGAFFSVGFNQAGGQDLAGVIDEVALYPTVLSAAKILDHFTKGAPPPVVVPVPGVYPPGYVASITGSVVSGDGHLVGGSTAAQFGVPIAFISIPATTVPVSGVASAAAFGAVTPTARITRTVAGIGSAQAFGSIYLRVTLGSGGVLSAQAFGVPVPKTVITVAVGGKVSSQSFGTVTVQTVVRPVAGGVSSAQAFGTVITVKGPVSRTAVGLGSAQAFGTVTPVITGAPQTVPVSGRASAQAFGAVLIQTAGATGVSGVSSAQSFGVPLTVKGAVSRAVTGVSSAQGFGTVTVAKGVAVRTVTGLGSAQSFGVPVSKATVTRAVGSVATAQSFGTLTVSARITRAVTGLGTAQALGTPTAVLVGAGTPQTVPVQGLSLYTTVTSITGQVISGDGHTVGSSTYQLGQFGSLTIQARITKTVVGLSSAQSFGAARAANVVYVLGITTAQRFGTTVARPGPVTISVSGLGSAQRFGLVDVFVVWLYALSCNDLVPDPVLEAELVLAAAGETELTPVPATDIELVLGAASEADLDLGPLVCQ